MDLRQEDVELDERGKPLASFHDGINNLVKFLTVTSVFLFTVKTALQIEDLSHSPVILILGWVAGFVIVLVSWVLAFVLSGMFLGDFPWANSLFTLLKDDGFRSGIALLCLSFFFTRILAGAFEKLSYAKKKILCMFLTAFTLIFLAWLFHLLESSQKKYCFLYAVALFFYAVVAFPRTERKDEKKQKRERQR
jgi:hypothetical protein